MKIIHLRHASKNKGNKHINNNGLQTAQQVGKLLESFDLVLTSVSIRAVETCIGMGYAVDDTIDFSKCDQVIEKPRIELEEKTPFLEYYKEFEKKSRIYEFGINCRHAIINKIKEFNLNQEGEVLLVTHGGVIESSTIAFNPDKDYATFGQGVGHCEGVRLILDKDYMWIEGEPFRHNFA